METPKSISRTRKRGIRASRVKLEKAMSKAGFKTQASLAEHIANIEKLENAPRDFVSKVFREQFVAPSSIERIALALGVEAYTLYQSSTDETILYSEKVQDPISDVKPIVAPVVKSNGLLFNNSAKTSRLILSTFFLSILLLAFWFWWQTSESKTRLDTPRLELKYVSIAVPEFSNPGLPRFSGSLRKSITENFQTPSPAAMAIGHSVSPWETIENLNVDFVIEGNVYTYGRHTGLLIYLVGTKSRTLLGSFSGLELAETETNINRLVSKINFAIASFFDRKPIVDDQLLNKDPLINYLKGLEQIDKSLTEINIRRAFDLIQRVLRVAPKNVKARAMLCDVLVRQSILNGDKSLLVDAENECAKVSIVTPNLPELLFSLAQVKRKQGKTDEAIELYKKALEEYPMFVSAHLGLAEALINKVQLSKDKTYFEEALTHTLVAEQYQPSFWKIPFVASRVRYYSGQVDKAIEELERSKAMSVNINNVGNLGTMHFCNGDMLKAEQNYLTLNEISESNAFNENFLGVISFAKEDYSKAVSYFESSLLKMQADSSEGMYLAWINLADAYFANGDLIKAQETYEQAIILADAYRLNGENGNNIEAHIFYSNLKAYLTSNDVINEQNKLRLLNRLETIAEKATDPGALVRVMLSWVELGELERARPIFEHLSRMCKGYAAYPLLRKYFS